MDSVLSFTSMHVLVASNSTCQLQCHVNEICAPLNALWLLTYCTVNQCVYVGFRVFPSERCCATSER